MFSPSPSEPPIKVVAICGSLRPGSYTRKALAIALEGAEQLGAQTRLIDLQDYQLPFCGNAGGSSAPGDVARLQRDVAGAQGIILGTPEYHGSFSGVLKNALDLMGFAEFEGKMLGLVGVSAGGQGGIHALNSLRMIGLALHAWVIPEQACVPLAHKVFDDQGRMSDPKLEERLKNVGRTVARFAYLHSSSRAREFLSAWEAQSVPPILQVAE